MPQKLDTSMVYIGVKGYLKVTLTDLTGKVLQVEEGPNLVLNTGLEDICRLIAGDTQVPVDLVSGQSLHETVHALPRVPLYGQFGNSAQAPASDDASIFDNGTLDKNAASPQLASDILRSTAFYPLSSTTPPISNQVTVQFTLSPSQGNGPGGTDTIYREAVLMSKMVDNPIQYRWFARKTFGDIIKNPTSIMTAEWTFVFVVPQ